MVGGEGYWFHYKCLMSIPDLVPVPEASVLIPPVARQKDWLSEITPVQS